MAEEFLNKTRNNDAHKHNCVLGVGDLNGVNFDCEEIQHQACEAACIKGASDAAKIPTRFFCRKIKAPNRIARN